MNVTPTLLQSIENRIFSFSLSFVGYYTLFLLCNFIINSTKDARRKLFFPFNFTKIVYCDTIQKDFIYVKGFYERRFFCKMDNEKFFRTKI